MAGEKSFGRRREGAGLLMPHMDPIDFAAIDGMGDPVQRFAEDPEHSSRRGSQNFDR